MKKFALILCILILGLAAQAHKYTPTQALNLLQVNEVQPNSRLHLMNACSRGNKELAILLIDAQQIDLNKKFMNTTYLMQAVYYKNTDIAIYLLENGADPKIKIAGGGDALFFAVKTGQSEVVKKILESQGIDVNRLNMKNIAKHKKYTEIYEMLVNYEKEQNSSEK